MDFKDILKKRKPKLFQGDGHRDSPSQPTPPSPSSPSSITSLLASTRSVLSASALGTRPTSIPSAHKRTEGDDTQTDYWPNLTTLLGLLSHGLLPPLKAALDDIKEFVRTYEDAVAARTEHQALRAQLEGLFGDLCGYLTGSAPPTMTTSMLNLCRAIQTELEHLSRNKDKNSTSRYLQANQDLDIIISCYRQIQSHLERLMLNVNLSTWAIVDKQATEARLARIAPSLPASYNSAEAALVRRRECAARTREQVLLDLTTWKDNEDGEKICWLSGMAGTGKTTIAATLCSILDGSHELGANFFCTRSLPECRNVKLILPTIAYQLARFSSPFQGALSQVLEHDPDVHAKALQVQFKYMIFEPLWQVMDTFPRNVVVVIDALDECEDDDGVERMLDVLLKDGSKLPIKFLVSSRPEPHIRDRIAKSTSKAQLTLHELEEKMVKADIETYLREELSSISLSDSQFATLVEHAGVLFIYAATMVRYIRSGNTLKRLDTVLKSSSSREEPSNNTREIDNLYEVVLKSALSNPNLERSEEEQRKLVLHTVVCAQEPLTIGALAGLLMLSSAEVQEALRPLWSVLHVSESSGTSRVSLLHASFSDYILDPDRSKQFACHAEIHNGKLAYTCFRRIDQNQPQFNICNLASSYVFDRDVPNIDENVYREIPLDLLYACQYWLVHLDLGSWYDEQITMMHEFLSKRLLLWMEVLNLTKRINKAVGLVEKATSWIQALDCPDSLRTLAQDARRFVTIFATSPIASSTPHLYVSMLASWSQDQPLARCYSDLTLGLVNIKGIQTAERQLPLLCTILVGYGVNCVTFSPNGRFFAAGILDSTILVWDSLTYRMVTDPIQGHTGSILSMTISPDSTRLCSSSEDRTIRVWNPQNGRLIMGPLEGHTGWIYSINHSPDGQWVVSGSSDGTVRIWSTKNGQLMGKPLRGNGEPILSVSFSPNGSTVAAATSGAFIHLWDLHTGQLIGSPLNGNTAHTRAINFLPGGEHLISGSKDGTMHIWDLSMRESTGVSQANSLREHVLQINDIAISSDGATCVSASDDSTVRIWDIQTQKTRSVLWHTSVVTSVAFSPDCSRLVSGSHDNSVRVWEAETLARTVEGNQSHGHTDWVDSVTFSPCGTQIISGSDDTTVRIWDAQSGHPVGNPLKGHSGRVNFVSTSTDGHYIASISEDQTIRVWNRENGSLHKIFGPMETDGYHDAWYQMYWPAAFSFHHNRIVCGSHSGRIYAWEGNEQSFVLTGHTPSAVSSVSFAPDGQSFISGSSNGELKLWDTSSGEQLFHLTAPERCHTGGINSTTFSTDGLYVASCSADTTVRLWNTKDGMPVGDPLEGHTAAVSSIAFSPHGEYLVSGAVDMSIRVWDVRTGISIAVLHGHTDRVCSVSFSPDGTRIASGSADRTVRLWSAPVANSTSVVEGPISPSRELAGATDYSEDLDWTMDGDGWVYDRQDRLLLWVPPDLRNVLIRPKNTLLISRQGRIELDFTHARTGDLWTTCYQPPPPASSD